MRLIGRPESRRLVKNRVCRGPGDYVDADCDCCTPNQIHYFFCDGREALIPWVGKIVPPPPAVNTDDPRHHARIQGDRRILLEWDNAPELVADPRSGRFLFCGYRIWRVEGWERPIGSHGPAPNEWQLMAELVPDPVGTHYEQGQPPAALEEHGVRPRWDPVPAAGWESTVAVVPNPYRGHAAWDLTPSSADPLGAHVEFIGLPGIPCDIRSYTLAGDLVRKLHHDPAGGRGCLSWNLLSRNRQGITSGIYLYAVTCRGETLVGRFTIVR